MEINKEQIILNYFTLAVNKVAEISTEMTDLLKKTNCRCDISPFIDKIMDINSSMFALDESWSDYNTDIGFQVLTPEKALSIIDLYTIRYDMNDSGTIVYPVYTYLFGQAAQDIDLSGYYTKAESDNRFYPRFSNPENYINQVGPGLSLTGDNVIRLGDFKTTSPDSGYTFIVPEDNDSIYRFFNGYNYYDSSTGIQDEFVLKDDGFNKSSYACATNYLVDYLNVHEGFSNSTTSRSLVEQNIISYIPSPSIPQGDPLKYSFVKMSLDSTVRREPYGSLSGTSGTVAFFATGTKFPDNTLEYGGFQLGINSYAYGGLNSFRREEWRINANKNELWFFVNPIKDIAESPTDILAGHTGLKLEWYPNLDGVAIMIADPIRQRGVVYDGNYEPNFVPRSLVTRQYVDGLISSISSIGAGAGLSIDVNGDIQLGNDGVGFVDISDTSVFVNGFQVNSYSDGLADFYSQFSSEIYVGNFGASLLIDVEHLVEDVTTVSSNIGVYDDTGYIELDIRRSTDPSFNYAIFKDAINSKGLQYEDDYSAVGTLDDRWIPDWGAVKAETIGRITTSAPSSPTSTGIKGTFAYDTNFIYICVDTDTWIRATRDITF